MDLAYFCIQGFDVVMDGYDSLLWQKKSSQAPAEACVWGCCGLLASAAADWGRCLHLQPDVYSNSFSPVETIS